MNAFNAALEAEYAGRFEAGTIAKLDPVLLIQLVVELASL